MSETALKTVQNAKGRVLAVEDDATTLAILSNLLEEMGYDVLEAENGHEALDIIEREAGALDVIVLDKMMPGLDGLEVVEKLKKDVKARHIPIVMVTGANKPEEIKEGIDAGVFYYLTKPYEDDVFQSILTAAMREAERRNALKTELNKHHSSFSFIDRAAFTIRTLEEAENLACFLANCFPNPDTALSGLAALLINAVEHGNLEIGYFTKTRLLKDNQWRAEIDRRAELPEYKARRVKVELIVTDEKSRVTVKDEGPGFDWDSYLDIDPARALHNHGRGIAQAAKISFDELIYNQSGNEVTAISHQGSSIKW